MRTGLFLFMLPLAVGVPRANPVTFEEVVRSAKYDPDYFDFDYWNIQVVNAGVAAFSANIHTIMRDSTTFYQVNENSVTSPITFKANPCYIAEQNQVKYQDDDFHRTPVQDTVYYLMLPFATIINSFSGTVLDSVADSLWVLDYTSGDTAFYLEYDPNIRKITFASLASPRDTSALSARYAAYPDSLWKDTVIYPQTFFLRTSVYSAELDTWSGATVRDSIVNLVRANGILNGLFLDGDNYPCDDGTTITVVSPAGGEVWPSGTQQTIRWETSGINGDILVQYHTGTRWEFVATQSDTLDGIYPWTVPEGLPDSTRLKFRAMRSFAETHSAYFYTREISLVTSPLPSALIFRFPGGKLLFNSKSYPSRIKIFESRGNLVRQLEMLNGRVTWDGQDRMGNPVPGGIYFFQAGNHSEKFMLLH